MKTLGQILPMLSPAERAWLTIGPQKYGWTPEVIRARLRGKTGEDIDLDSISRFLKQKGISTTVPSVDLGDESAATEVPPFSNAMERDIEIALLSQLDSLGLTLFTDDEGRSGQQYPAGNFGQIDVLARDSNGTFVVIELKREDAPRKTIGQLAGYIAFVRKQLAQGKGDSVVGWILARPTSPMEDQILQEAAEAVGITVKWYWVRLEFVDGQPSTAS